MERKYLPSTTWALRWSWVCSSQAADSSPGRSADLRRASNWTSSGPGSSTPTCWRSTRQDSCRGSVAVAKSWRDVRAPLSWADSESGWGSVCNSISKKDSRDQERARRRALHVRAIRPRPHVGRRKNHLPGILRRRSATCVAF